MRNQYDILLVEPSDIIRQGLASILQADSASFNLLAPLRDASDLPLRLPTLQPDILIINPSLLPSPPRLFLANLQQARPSMAIVGLVYQYIDPQLLQSFKHLLDIREPRNRIARILLDSVTSSDETPNENESYELSDRENSVLLLVAQGCSSKEIADRLCISIHTVNTHRKNITRKTGIKSVAGLAVYAMLHNLIPPSAS